MCWRGMFNLNIEPKNENQRKYIENLRNNEITICVGCSGVGKSFCALGIALEKLFNKKIGKIIVIKSLVEADFDIGALPGNLYSKIHNNFLSFEQIFLEFMSFNELMSLKKKKIIEFTPLNYMRGLTFKDAFVIIDEVQNLNLRQLKLALSRLHHNSRAALIGDLKQSDIKGVNALEICLEQLNDIKGIGVCSFDYKDILRHSLISKILYKLNKIVD